MTFVKWVGAVLAIFLLFGAAHAQDLSSVSTKDLISKLQDESAQGMGVCVNIEFMGFIAIEDPIIYDAWGSSLFRNPGFIKPVTSPVMRELVRRGVAALPMLIDHLSDARPTKLTLSYPFIACFSYEPRDPEKPPAGVKEAETPSKRGMRSSYTLKVGDFCLVAVGQIVNRHLNAIQPGPDGLGINSPVETPALAAAVKADWGGVTPADHERSLEKDALDPLVVGVWLDAIKRLVFYYPEPGAAVAVHFLNSPLYDTELVSDFVEKRLFKTTDEGKQDRLIAEFRKENGEANYTEMQSWLIDLSTSPPDALFYRAILERAFPGVDVKHPPKSAGIDLTSMSGLVAALAIYPSKAIDEAVYGVLKRTSEMHPTILQSVTERCQLVHACAWRLTKPDERDAFEKSYRAVMSYLPKKRQSGKEPQAGKTTAFSKRFQAFLDEEIGKLAPHEEFTHHPA